MTTFFYSLSALASTTCGAPDSYVISDFERSRIWHSQFHSERFHFLIETPQAQSIDSLPAILAPQVATTGGEGATGVGSDVAAHGWGDAQPPLDVVVGRNESSA